MDERQTTKATNMRWIKLSHRKPSVLIDGEKVMIYRIPTAPQEASAIDLLDTNMVKYCVPNETWWMALPEKPKH